jgi:ABC-type glycerol-3-phosphate transport system substrate-binding protein
VGSRHQEERDGLGPHRPYLHFGKRLDMSSSSRRLMSSSIRAAAAAACALVVVACGGSNATHSTAAAGKQTLVVWQWWSTTGLNLQRVEQKLDAEFEARYPQYKVDDIPVALSDMATKLTAAIAAEAGPDLVNLYPGVAGANYRNGLIPLQSYLTPSDRQTWGLLSQAAVPGGNIIAIPWTEYGYFLYYNKKLFAKAGLDPNSPPSTYQEFIAACQKLDAHGITPLAGGFKDGYQWDGWMFPFTDQLMSPTVSKSFEAYNYPINSPILRTVYSYVKAVSKFYGKDAAGLNMYNDAFNEFNSGKAAMILDSPTISDFTTAQQALGNTTVGAFPVPRLAASKYPPFVDTGAGLAWGITKWAANKTAAWDYIQWMESKPAQETMWSLGSFIPNNTQVPTPAANPAEASLLENMKNPVNHSIFEAIPISVLAIEEKYASEMAAGQVSLSSVLQQMEQLEQELRPKIVGIG